MCCLATRCQCHASASPPLLAQRGTSGRELVEEFACELEAGQALEAAAQAKRRLGYQDL